MPTSEHGADDVLRSRIIRTDNSVQLNRERIMEVFDWEAGLEIDLHVFKDNQVIMITLAANPTKSKTPDEPTPEAEET